MSSFAFFSILYNRAFRDFFLAGDPPNSGTEFPNFGTESVGAIYVMYSSLIYYWPGGKIVVRTSENNKKKLTQKRRSRASGQLWPGLGAGHRVRVIELYVGVGLGLCSHSSALVPLKTVWDPAKSCNSSRYAVNPFGSVWRRTFNNLGERDL